MNPKITLLVTAVIASAGCVGASPHHETAKDLRFPPGVIDERETDTGRGPAHHIELVKIYPAGTNVSELDEALVGLAEDGGWTILARSNVTNHTRTFDATWVNPFEEYFSCQTGRTASGTDSSRGVPVECRVASRLMSFDPHAGG